MKTMLMVQFIFLSSVILRAAGPPADSLKVYDMGEIVITATRSEKSVDDISKSVSVLGRDKLNGSYNKLLSSSINAQAGLYLVGDGQNYGMNQSIFMRGANSNQSVIMVDDVRITDPSSVNNAPDLSELSVSNVERVEIVRGINSPLYGSSAIGGVINLLSRKIQEPGFNAEVGLSAGTFGRSTFISNQNLFLNYSSPRGYYLNLTAGNLTAKGIDATEDTSSRSVGFKNRDKDRFLSHDVGLKAGFIDDRIDVYASFNRTDQSKDLDKRAYLDDDNFKLDFARNLVTYGLSYEVSAGIRFKIVGGYSKMERRAIDDSSMVDWDGNYDHSYNDERYGGTALTDDIQLFVRSGDLEFMLGGGLYDETMSSRQYYYSNSDWGLFESLTDLDSLHLRTSTKSLYFHNIIPLTLIDRSLGGLSISVGGRVLDHSTFGTEFVYELNPSFKFGGGTTLYLSVADGFSAPSLYQLFSPNRDPISGIRRGNENLKPEKSSSVEIGVIGNIAPDTRYELSYYETRTSGAIEFVYLWDGNIGLDTLGKDWLRNDYRGETYLNLGDQVIRGVELSITHRVSDLLTLGAALEIVDGKSTFSPENIDADVTRGNHVQVFNTGYFIDGRREYSGLVRRPSKAGLSLSFTPHDKVELDLRLKYVGRRGDIFYDSNLGPYGALGSIPVEDYSLTDLRCSYRPTEEFAISAEIENLFDADYREIKGYSTRGRGLFLNVNYSI